MLKHLLYFPEASEIHWLSGLGRQFCQAPIQKEYQTRGLDDLLIMKSGDIILETP